MPEHMYVGVFVDIEGHVDVKVKTSKMVCTSCNKERSGKFCSDCGGAITTKKKTIKRTLYNIHDIITYLEDAEGIPVLDRDLIHSVSYSRTLIPNYISDYNTTYDIDELPSFDVTQHLNSYNRAPAILELKTRNAPLFAALDKYVIPYRIRFGVHVY